MTVAARILEVFSSLQGEGVRLGERQIFVRFAGCNLCCDYCDEPGSIPLSGGEDWALERLRSKIKALERVRKHQAVSWTGGEPLLHMDFLQSMMPWARARGLANYLETNGTLPAALKKVAKFADIVAMDIKLSSATGANTWSAHEKFLRVIPERTFVKVVLTEFSTKEEWRKVIELMRELAPRSPLVLQPATPAFSTCEVGSMVRPIAPTQALEFLRAARGALKDVRLIPQWHPIWGMP